MDDSAVIDIPPSIIRNGKRTCAECLFHFHDAEGHWCRRYPPQVSVLMVPLPNSVRVQGATPVGPKPFSTYPPIDPAAPCGEFALATVGRMMGKVG